MTFRCLIAHRNKTVAHTFLLSFVNGNEPLCQEQYLRSRNFATMVTWRHASLYFSEFLWVSWCERVFSQTVKKQWVCEIILLCVLLPGRSFKFGCFVISRNHFCVHHATDVLCPITVTNWTIDVILRELKPILCLSASFRFVLWCIVNER